MNRGEFGLAFGLFLKHAGVRHFTAFELCDVGRQLLDPETGEPVLVDGRGVYLKAPPAHLWTNILGTALIADDLRDELGPLRVASGYRDPEYNAALGSGAKTHPNFLAMDLHPLRATPRDLQRAVLRHRRAQSMGIGGYSWGAHIDTRGHKARWGDLP